ncbi:MAG: flavodoxin-dependent (E)-4-hydroxy-3-methylbut-2-enyl-diphosphate synthase [Candidatus Riflebacteria bacterium]|nr:flavodoxin-dependent (E)-4-hydroxy-3-methylbut-2-enyl-diphosphate synthase [Candidatus Riflebacteria bacterium]
MVPSVVCDLRRVGAAARGAIDLARAHGAELFLVEPCQLPSLTAHEGAPVDFLSEWSSSLDGVALDPLAGRFLLEASELAAFRQWAGARRGNLEAVLRFAAPDLAHLTEDVTSFLEARPGLSVALAPTAADVPSLVTAGRRLLAAAPWPLALLPSTGTWDETEFVLGAAWLLESRRVRMLLSPGASPVESVQGSTALLNALELRRFGVNYVSCPTCGRCEVPLEQIVAAVRERTAHVTAPITVAIMGCVVNGPGESRHADLGVAAGKSGGVLIKDGKVAGKLQVHELVDTLVREIEALAVRKGAP